MKTLEFEIGKKINSLRKIRGYALRDLAEKCGLSANAISMIERGENSPNISSLKRISEALGLSIKELFEENDKNPVVYTKRSQGMKINKTDFEIENLGFGYPDYQIKPYHLVINPKVDTSSKVISHPGEEFVYCIMGEINYYVGTKQFHLVEGDSLLFDASNPHGWCNPTAEIVRLLLIFHSFDQSHLAHQRHVEMDMGA